MKRCRKTLGLAYGSDTGTRGDVLKRGNEALTQGHYDFGRHRDGVGGRSERKLPRVF